MRTLSGHSWPAEDVSLSTTRPDGTAQQFRFVQCGEYLESESEIPEPHQFTARLSLGHVGHSHDYDLDFHEHEHDHGHNHSDLQGLELSVEGIRTLMSEPTPTTSATASITATSPLGRSSYSA